MSYKPGDKLVLEIKKENIDKVLGIKTYNVKDVLDAVFPEYILDEFDRLDSAYINEHYGVLQDRAYVEGKNAGIEEGKLVGYEQGMNNAWEIAKKLYLSKKNGGLSEVELEEIFGQMTTSEIFMKYTPQEVESKIEAWEKAKTEIKVGDVVEHLGVSSHVVIRIFGKDGYVLLDKEGHTIRAFKSQLTKTGRSIDIASVLEQIGGNT